MYGHECFLTPMFALYLIVYVRDSLLGHWYRLNVKLTQTDGLDIDWLISYQW